MVVRWHRGVRITYDEDLDQRANKLVDYWYGMQGIVDPSTNPSRGLHLLALAEHKGSADAVVVVDSDQFHIQCTEQCLFFDLKKPDRDQTCLPTVDSIELLLRRAAEQAFGDPWHFTIKLIWDGQNKSGVEESRYFGRVAGPDILPQSIAFRSRDIEVHWTGPEHLTRAQSRWNESVMMIVAQIRAEGRLDMCGWCALPLWAHWGYQPTDCEKWRSAGCEKCGKKIPDPRKRFYPQQHCSRKCQRQVSSESYAQLSISN